MDENPSSVKVEQKFVSGTFDLIFSSAVADLPIIGGLLDGYLPNRETIIFDFDAGIMSLEVEILPFLPTIDILGENLSWDESLSTLSYNIKGKSSTSQWNILYSDEEVLAAKSSVTGLNVIKKTS